MFERQRFLDLLQHFIVFEEDPDTGALHKIIAGYHQFHAVNAAVEETVRASGMTETGGIARATRAPTGRAGCTAANRATVARAWSGTRRAAARVSPCSSTPGSMILHPAMNNPTLVVLTDRNDLDDQLFGQFQRCAEILGQKPVQADEREHLRELLQVASGGVVFTTIQKFLPERGARRCPCLSDRRNIVVIADEAHRSQYGFGAR